MGNSAINKNFYKIDDKPFPQDITNYFQVKFIDFDGEVLKEEWVLEGHDATPPKLPEHPYLTFQEWNNSYANIQKDLNIGAIYTTTDGLTHIWVAIGTTDTTGMQPTMYLNKTGANALTINWGDNTTSTTTSTGNISVTKSTPYTNSGEYKITVSAISGDTYTFGNGTTTTQIFGDGTYRNIVNKIYLSNSVTNIGVYSFYLNWCLQKISIPMSVTALYASCFNSAITLISVNTPSTTTSIINAFPNCTGLQTIAVSENSFFTSAMFSNSASLKYTIIPERQVSIGSLTFNNCSCLRLLIFPKNITSIGSTVITTRALNDIVFQSRTPPTINSDTFTSPINPSLRIYVPDASLNNYKTATNWSILASYIYPVSQRIIKQRL